MASSAKKRKALIKVVMIGETKVGKTSVMNQWVSKKFSLREKSTIGADFMTRELEVDGRIYTFQLWDTAGQERFHSLGTAFYRGSDACLMVYDCNNMKSVEALEKHYNDFMLSCAPTNPAQFPFLLLGNKVDQGDNPDVYAAALAWQSTQVGNSALFKCSACTNTGLDDAFADLCRRINAAAGDDTTYIMNKSLLDEPSSTPSTTSTTGGGWFSSFMAAGLEAKKKLDAKKAAEALAEGKSSAAVAPSTVTPSGGLPIESASAAPVKPKKTLGFFQKHMAAGEEFNDMSQGKIRRVSVRFDFHPTDDSIPGVFYWKVVGDAESKEKAINMSTDFGNSFMFGKNHPIFGTDVADNAGRRADALCCFSILSNSAPNSLHLISDDAEIVTKWMVAIRDMYTAPIAKAKAEAAAAAAKAAASIGYQSL